MGPYYDEGGITIYHGDCLDVMRSLPCATDAVVTDPPYGLGFMGQKWDALPPGREWGEACLRVLKPGGHLLAFGGTRTSHRLACAIEDAGFEIRDTICWLYGSGFPKSLDVSKAIDKAAGAEREVVGERVSAYGTDTATGERVSRDGGGAGLWAGAEPKSVPLTGGPVISEAQEWDGWGTALKPAHEPIVVARKPLAGTVAANVLAHGTGALNIDGCRIGTDENWDGDDRPYSGSNGYGPDDADGWTGNWTKRSESHTAGRWPANVVLGHHADCRQTGVREIASNGHFPASRPAGSAVAGASGHGGQDGLSERHTRGETVEVWDCHPDCPVRMLDEQTGELPRGFASANSPGLSGGIFGAGRDGEGFAGGYPDTGGASRFFYCAKASRRERGADNTHPTVKPLALMRWLVRLVSPGNVLDPFMGSGSTLLAAQAEGRHAIGIEIDERYCEIAAKRLAQQLPLEAVA